VHGNFQTPAVRSQVALTEPEQSRRRSAVARYYEKVPAKVSSNEGLGATGWLVVLCLLVGGVALFPLAASQAHHSSIACRREAHAVLCELRKVYPGSIATTDRLQLHSATVETRSYVLRGTPRSYGILVLNSEIEVPGSDPGVLAARLAELLDGRATAVPAITLREPSYGIATLLGVLGALLSGCGALVVWVQLVWRSRSTVAQTSARSIPK
jgi:hypothetical protein